MFLQKKYRPKDCPTINIFEFLNLVLMLILGGIYWFHTKVIIIKTNSAVWYKNFAIGFHEKHTLTSKIQTNATLPYCLVDDQFGVISPDQKNKHGNFSIKTI